MNAQKPAAPAATEIDEAGLDAVAGGGLSQDMKNYLISSLSDRGAAGAPPEEEVSLTFRKIT